jgi:putative DNA primase/helicase
LATLATCLQKRFEASSDGDEHKENLSLWTITALEPGARKTAVKHLFVEPLSDWETEQLIKMKPEIKSVKNRRDINQKLIDQLKAQAAKPDTNSAGREELMSRIEIIQNETPDELTEPRIFSDDTTPETLQSLMLVHGERMAILSDEAAILEIMAGLYSGGKANLNIFLQGHSGSPVRVDRQGRSVMLNKPALTFGLVIQPAIISELSSGNKARFRGTGILARFLYCLPKSTVGSRNVSLRIKIPEDVKTAYNDGIMRLLAIKPNIDNRGHEQPRLLILSPEALQSWLEFSQFVEDRQGQDGEFYDIQDWTSKLPGAALRIAGLLHVAEYGETIEKINATTIERALDLADLLISHARAAFEMMSNEPAQDDAQTVLRWIVANGKRVFRQNDALKSIRQFRTVERLVQALKVLTGRNMISEPLKRGTGGRPSIQYTVNPAILPKGGGGLHK